LPDRLTGRYSVASPGGSILGDTHLIAAELIVHT
jgi:hypothetical protein